MGWHQLNRQEELLTGGGRGGGRWSSWRIVGNRIRKTGCSVTHAWGLWHKFWFHAKPGAHSHLWKFTSWRVVCRRLLYRYSGSCLCRLILTFLSGHNTWTTALSNSVKLGAMPYRATQDGRVMVESLTKHGPLEKGMANHFSVLALRTPWTVWKGEKIGHWKMNSPGW